MTWTKFQKEPFGILCLYLNSGAQKYFIEITKSEAIKQAKMWLCINKIRFNL